MKILLLTNHSKDNQTLAALTAQNTWRYSARHNYDLFTERVTWENAKLGCLQRLRTILFHATMGQEYDAIVTIGSDVLFMNHAIPFESIIQPRDHVIMSYERLGENHGYTPDGFSPINNDVTIWHRTPETLSFLKEIIDAAPEWLKMRHLWQQWLATKILSHSPAYPLSHSPFPALRLVEPRVMNATLQPGSGQWQPGDFILHLLAMPYPLKCAMARHHLTMAIVD